MKLHRRDFLKTSLAASAAASVANRASAAPAGAAREYYELRAYRVKAGASLDPVEGYLEKALLPALAKRGIKNVGVFSELEVDKRAATSKPKAETPLWVLIPYASLEAFASVGTEINADPAVQAAGAAYLGVAKASPAFERIDTWLYRAFASMPKMEVPAFAAKRTPTRIFEMRDYESHSERAALSKMAMFDNGETQIMRDLGMSPLFFGQGVAGPNLPHLRYITGGPDLAAHLAPWAKFGPDPRWVKLKEDPQYKDNTSKNTARFLAPKACSQL